MDLCSERISSSDKKKDEYDDDDLDDNNTNTDGDIYGQSSSPFEIERVYL